MKDEPLELKDKQKLPIPPKRPSKKKQKDKPKRPLSAYNFFFKEEREKILKIVLAKDNDDETKNDPDSADFLDEDALKRLRKEGGKVSFEEMGKVIGQRWKNIDPNALSRFSELAAEDTERYKKEMTEYNGRQEQKMRNEALKPQPTFRDNSKAVAFGDASMMMMNPQAAQGYPMGGYYGMDFYGGAGGGAGGMAPMYAPYGYGGMGGGGMPMPQGGGGGGGGGDMSGRMDGNGGGQYMMGGQYQGGGMMGGAGGGGGGGQYMMQGGGGQYGSPPGDFQGQPHPGMDGGQQYPPNGGYGGTSWGPQG